jgi:hypothetical protein
MIRFAEVFRDEAIVSALRRELSWTHFKETIYFDDPLKRNFYAESCRIERWSTRTLQHKIGHLLYERTAVSKKPADSRPRSPGGHGGGGRAHRANKPRGESSSVRLLPSSRGPSVTLKDSYDCRQR